MNSPSQKKENMSQELLCPLCGASDMLATIESLQGLAECDFIGQEGPEWSGTTNVLFEDSKTIGVACQCGWEYEGEDWLDQLLAS